MSAEKPPYFSTPQSHLGLLVFFLCFIFFLPILLFIIYTSNDACPRDSNQFLKKYMSADIINEYFLHTENLMRKVDLRSFLISENSERICKSHI